MSVSDIKVLNYITFYGLPISIFVILLIIFIRNFKYIRNRLFSKFMSKFELAYGSLMKDYKKYLFTPLYKIVSADVSLQCKGLIRILEIGVRTGDNLKYYPDNSHIVLVDRNIYFESYFKTNPNKIIHLNVERYLISRGENLRGIPDCSVDAVVATLILCSAYNVDQVLQEIKRVLVPGGKYFFLEHVPERKGTFLNAVQSLLSVTKIWPILLDGCHLNRNAKSHIVNAGFSDVSCKHISIEAKQVFLLRFMRSHLLGVATK